MHAKYLLTAIAVALSLTTIVRAEPQKLYYPSEDEAMFSIKAPDSWKVTKIDEVGDFATLENDNNSVVQFRAVELESPDEAKKEIDSISEDIQEFLKDNYTDIDLGDVKEFEVGGKPGVHLVGSCKDKDGKDVKILSAIVALDPKTVAEIWAAVYAEGNDSAEAGDIIGSFMPASN